MDGGSRSGGQTTWSSAFSTSLASTSGSRSSTSRTLGRGARAPAEVDLEPDAGEGVAHHAPAVGEPLDEIEAPAAGLALTVAAGARLEAGPVVAHLHVDHAPVERHVDVHHPGGWHVGVPHAVRDELRHQ